MINYNMLNKQFPNIDEIEPDSQIILFAYDCTKAGVYIDEINLLMGMFKYILNGRVSEYRKDYTRLYYIYNSIFS